MTVSVPFTSGSSLQQGPSSCPRSTKRCFSSLYIGILAATRLRSCIIPFVQCFSSLYIGILAATVLLFHARRPNSSVSVPFTSGSSLQRLDGPRKEETPCVSVPFTSGSSLQQKTLTRYCGRRWFQFPLHRDPRCNL